MARKWTRAELAVPLEIYLTRVPSHGYPPEAWVHRVADRLRRSPEEVYRVLRQFAALDARNRVVKVEDVEELQPIVAACFRDLGHSVWECHVAAEEYFEGMRRQWPKHLRSRYEELFGPE